MYKSNPPT